MPRTTRHACHAIDPTRERSGAVTAIDASADDEVRSSGGPGQRPAAGAGGRDAASGATPHTASGTPDTSVTCDADAEDTLDLRLPEELLAPYAGLTCMAPTAADRPGVHGGDDLLDRVADWAPVSTPAGSFRLVPVRIERDLPLLCHWMNDPAVAAFWQLAGPASVTEEHLLPQLEGDGRSVPCLGVLDGSPMSYWEIYRADLDPLARHYPARPHDTGVHLLIGGVADRGRGIGSLLLRTVADLVLDHRPSCPRVVAEPDLRNTPSVAAFLSAGFRFAAELDLPDKRAALMVRDRALRQLLRPVHLQ